MSMVSVAIKYNNIIIKNIKHPTTTTLNIIGFRCIFKSNNFRNRFSLYYFANNKAYGPLYGK